MMQSETAEPKLEELVEQLGITSLLQSKGRLNTRKIQSFVYEIVRLGLPITSQNVRAEAWFRTSGEHKNHNTLKRFLSGELPPENPHPNLEKKLEEKFSREFVEKVAEHMPVRDVLTAIVRHETGHYTGFPRELSVKLHLLAEGEAWFGEQVANKYAWYSDLMDESGLLISGLAGDEMFDLAY